MEIISLVLGTPFKNFILNCRVESLNMAAMITSFWRIYFDISRSTMCFETRFEFSPYKYITSSNILKNNLHILK